jgi:hypothetical protein
MLKKSRSEPPSFETLALLAPQDEENQIVNLTLRRPEGPSRRVLQAFSAPC